MDAVMVSKRVCAGYTRAKMARLSELRWQGVNESPFGRLLCVDESVDSGRAYTLRVKDWSQGMTTRNLQKVQASLGYWLENRESNFFTHIIYPFSSLLRMWQMCSFTEHVDSECQYVYFGWGEISVILWVIFRYNTLNNIPVSDQNSSNTQPLSIFHFYCA